MTTKPTQVEILQELLRPLSPEEIATLVLITDQEIEQALEEGRLDAEAVRNAPRSTRRPGGDLGFAA